MKNYDYLNQRFIVNTYPNRGITLLYGKGVYLYDDKGNRYLDLMSNYGVNIFGYNHPTIINFLTNQLKKLTNLHGSFNNDTRAEAAKKIVQYCGKNFYQVYFSNSGAEAVEAAIKFAVLTTGKKTFIVCDNAYHGKTLGALSATAVNKYQQPFLPLLWRFIKIPFNDVDALKKAFTNDVAAFIIEPIQGEAGVILPQEDYLEKAYELCQKNKVLLIVDEIQTGVGRTGKFLACQKNNIKPDIVCLGKGLAAGIPIGVTVVNQLVAEKIPRNIHTSTFGGNPLACAGVLATLTLLNKKRLSYIHQMGEYFKNKLGLNVRGKGLMIGVTVGKEKRNKILKLLQEERILAIPAGEDSIRFLPPYIIKKEHIDFAVYQFKKILNHV